MRNAFVIRAAVAAAGLVLGGVGLAAAAPAARQPATAARGSSVIIRECHGTPVSAPRNLVLACADANTELTGLHWSGWGAGHATATGSLQENTCVPSCVAGKQRRYPVTVVVSSLAASAGVHRYTELELTYPHARPPRTPRTQRYELTAQGPALAA